MTAVFLKLVNMSITAGWLILAVTALRLILKKQPKALLCALWALVAVRLVCPVTFKSVLSLVPSAQTVSPDILLAPVPKINSGISAVNSAVNPVLAQSLTPAPGASANPLQIWIPFLTALWLAGVAALLVYAAVSYLRLRRRVRASLPEERGVFLCDDIPSPFAYV